MVFLKVLFIIEFEQKPSLPNKPTRPNKFSQLEKRIQLIHGLRNRMTSVSLQDVSMFIQWFKAYYEAETYPTTLENTSLSAFLNDIQIWILKLIRL